jgi:hypothetical protein
MIFGARGPRIGAYVCPRGVFAVECADAAGGIEVRRAFGEPIGLRNSAEAAQRLVEVLQSAGVTGARVSVTLRGFGVAHQNLQLPPAPDAVLDAVVEREVRRLEPHLADCVVQWMALPPVDTSVAGVPGAPPQRAVLATAAPTELIGTLDSHLAVAGHRLEHATTLPIALHRVLEQFDSGTGTVALVTALPDGAYVAFSLDGGVRLIVEPPLPQEAEHEAAALTEELELAVTFVRQQFRGTHVDRVVLVGSRRSLTELRTTITERIGVPAKPLEGETLVPPALAALGAVIDAGSSDPQSLGGITRSTASRSAALSWVETLSLAAVFVLVLAGLWTVAESVRTYRAGSSLAVARRRLEGDDFGLAALRSTAEQRKLVSRAMEAVRVAAADRAGLQSALAGLAIALPPPVAIDTLRLAWQDGGWRAVVGGAIESSSNARAVQALHDVYQDLPTRLGVESLRLDRLSYDEDAPGAAGESGVVRFQLSFALRAAGGNPR